MFDLSIIHSNLLSKSLLSPNLVHICFFNVAINAIFSFNYSYSFYHNSIFYRRKQKKNSVLLSITTIKSSHFHISLHTYLTFPMRFIPVPPLLLTILKFTHFYFYYTLCYSFTTAFFIQFFFIKMLTYPSVI